MADEEEGKFAEQLIGLTHEHSSSNSYIKILAPLSDFLFLKLVSDSMTTSFERTVVVSLSLSPSNSDEKKN